MNGKIGQKHIKKRIKRPSIERFQDMYIPEPMSGCWIWTGARFWGNGERRGKKLSNNRPCFDGKNASRSAFEIFNGPIPDGMMALHYCNNEHCVNPQHIYLGDHAKNMRDMVISGRSLSGEKNGFSKNTRIKIAAIRRLRSSGWTIEKLSFVFGLSISHVHRIVKKEAWAHV